MGQRLSFGLLLVIALAGCSGESAGLISTPSTKVANDVSVTKPLAIILQGVPPSSVTAGSQYLFHPLVVPGSGTVNFTITGQPGWTSFNSSTGTLSGTPTSADVGLSGNITIIATNSTSTGSVGPFTIRINAALSNMSAALSWVAPTQNTDGTPLTDLAGYYVYYGTNASALSETVQIADPTAVTHVVDNLSAGIWYFSVIAYSAQNVQSAASATVSKTIL